MILEISNMSGEFNNLDLIRLIFPEHLRETRGKSKILFAQQTHWGVYRASQREMNRMSFGASGFPLTLEMQWKISKHSSCPFRWESRGLFVLPAYVTAKRWGKQLNSVTKALYISLQSMQKHGNHFRKLHCNWLVAQLTEASQSDLGASIWLVSSKVRLKVYLTLLSFPLG